MAHSAGGNNSISVYVAHLCIISFGRNGMYMDGSRDMELPNYPGCVSPIVRSGSSLKA
jgi:hypothetical protein